MVRRCVKAHDRCFGGAGAPCPLCEGHDQSQCKVCGKFIRSGELCDKHASGNDPFVLADNFGADLR